MKKGFGKRVLAAASAFVLAASLAACGTQKKKEAGLQDVNIVLDWYPNAIHAFIYEAIERGYYAEEGLNVHVQFPSNENDAISLVSAGKAEFGLLPAGYYSDGSRSGRQGEVARRGLPESAEHCPLAEG